MSITREQVADLREGDVVSVTSRRWAEGTELGGPLWDDAGVLRCGPITIRYSDGYTAQNQDWKLTVVSRAPRPLYVNHPRTEPVPGDVVRVETGRPDDWYCDLFHPRTADDPYPWMSLMRDEIGKRYPSDEALPVTPEQGRVRLLVDGETGQVVPQEADRG